MENSGGGERIELEWRGANHSPDKEVPGAATESGMRLAVGQIDAILATPTVS